MAGVAAGSFGGGWSRERAKYNAARKKEDHAEKEAAGHPAQTGPGAQSDCTAKSCERPSGCCAFAVVHGGGNLRAPEPPRTSPRLCDKVRRHSAATRQAAG